MPPRRAESDSKGAAGYGREALGHWVDAARYGARAISATRKAKKAKDSTGSLLNPQKAKDYVGSLGSLVKEKAVPDSLVKEKPAPDSIDGDAGAADDHLFDDSAPMPIQESIDLAAPVAAVFDLCTRFEELPRFSERIEAVEVDDDTHFELEVRIGGRERTLPIEIVGEEPEERLDWECAEGYEHAGVITFHPLAPRLTRLELTIEPESEGVLERALRLPGIPERSIRQELRRFKAYAELWDEANDYRSADFKDPGSEPDEPEEPEAEEEPEEPEEEPDENSDEEAEEPLDEDEEEELEPAARE